MTVTRANVVRAATALVVCRRCLNSLAVGHRRKASVSIGAAQPCDFIREKFG